MCTHNQLQQDPEHLFTWYLLGNEATLNVSLVELTWRKSWAGFTDVEEEQQGDDYVCNSVNPLDDEHDEYGDQCLKKMTKILFKIHFCRK